MNYTLVIVANVKADSAGEAEDLLVAGCRTLYMDGANPASIQVAVASPGDPLRAAEISMRLDDMGIASAEDVD